MKKNFDIFVLSNIDYRVLRSKGDVRSQVQQNLYLLGDFFPGLTSSINITVIITAL